jgi:Ca2+-binding EF-hand superfamily protein
MSHQITTKVIHIRDSFSDFDRHNNGHVTKPQFVRVLPFENLTPAQKKFLIPRYFELDAGDINCKILHLDNSFSRSI